MSEQQIRVAADAAGQRIDQLLARATDLSRSAAARAVADGLILVNRKPVKPSQKVSVDDLITVDVAATTPAETEATPVGAVPAILFEDDDCYVVDKPSGVTVHAGAGTDGDTLVDRLVAAGWTLSTGSDPDRPGIVHRLDKNTTGAMLVAKHDKAHSRLVDGIKTRTISRQYLSLHRGGLPESLTIDAPIARDDIRPRQFATDEHGKAAVTHLRRLGAADDAGQTIVAMHAALDTGRTHQIRVHASAAGAPIVGDDLYGDPSLDPSVARPMLHARWIAFDDADGTRQVVASPVPADFRACADAFGLQEEVDGATFATTGWWPT